MVILLLSRLLLICATLRTFPCLLLLLRVAHGGDFVAVVQQEVLVDVTQLLNCLHVLHSSAQGNTQKKQIHLYNSLQQLNWLGVGQWGGGWDAMQHLRGRG